MVWKNPKPGPEYKTDFGLKTDPNSVFGSVSDVFEKF